MSVTITSCAPASAAALAASVPPFPAPTINSRMPGRVRALTRAGPAIPPRYLTVECACRVVQVRFAFPICDATIGKPADPGP